MNKTKDWLEASEFESIIERSGLAVFKFDPAAKAFFGNAAFFEEMGLTDGEEIAQIEWDAFCSLIDLESRAGFEQAFALLVEDGIPLEARVMLKIEGNPEVRDFSGDAIRNADGTVKSVVGTVRGGRENANGGDVQLQKMLSDHQQMIISSARLSALGEMASGIAHEINNPLTIISARASMLLSSLKDGKEVPPTELIKALEKISLTTVRISKIIKGLKMFSRSGEHDEFQEVSLASIIEDTVSFCSERFKNASVPLLGMESVPNINLSCRSTQISQVILNLLNNAFDAVQELPGEKWIRLSFEILPKRVQIRITDSGTGIPDAILEKIMQPFFTTKGVNKGTGLGLSISKGIVESHKGALFYQRGAVNTEFVVELPIL